MKYRSLQLYFVPFLKDGDSALASGANTNVLYPNLEEVLDELAVRLAVFRQSVPSGDVRNIGLPTGQSGVHDFDLSEAIEVG